MIPAEPVGPDEARRRILEELSRSEYHRGPGLIDRVVGAVSRWLDSWTSLGGATPGGTVALVVLLLAVVVLIVVVARRASPLRRRAVLAAPVPVTAGADVPASDLRRAAAVARDAGRTDEAVIAALRALVRDLADRTLLTVTDGMTAHEAALGAARAFPDLRGGLLRTADAFDTAAYSRRAASAKQAAEAVSLAEYVAQASPDRSVLESL